MRRCSMFHRWMLGSSIIVWFLLVCSVPFHPADFPASSLIYVSDYFLFVGEDDQGHVAFALDNNRGRKTIPGRNRLFE